MSRNASDVRPARAAGFTLVEMLVALVAGGLLIAGVVRFYRDSYHAYNLQDQIQERDQNAHFVATKFMEMLQQAGAGLPDSGWPVITRSGASTILAVNPRNALQFNGVAQSSSPFIPVSDASLWTNTGNVLLNVRYVLVDYADPAVPTRKYAIDRAYNARGFVAGVKDNPSGMDSIRITQDIDLAIGDRVYGYREDEYLIDGSDLVLRPDGNAATQMVIAENIDSLGFTFKDDNGLPTSSWRKMRSAHVSVRARTAARDPRITDGYRKITVPMNVIMRNRI
jgi:prepilin-type N-terminal cleavage/methylation domain-containing protein